MTNPQTFFEKVWTSHTVADLGSDTCLLQIDRLFLHEAIGAPALRRLEVSGRKIDSPRQVFGVVDHLISTRPGRGASEARSAEAAEMIHEMRAQSNAYGLTFFDTTDPRQGIVHVVSPELAIALPGTTLVCGDSHTCTVGGIGALAWGIGTSECEHVLATQTLTQGKPKAMRVTFNGALAPGVTPKDMVMYLIGQIGANGGIGYAVEFAGEAIRTMSVEGRLTVCNMAVEMQAKYGFVPPDEATFEYLKGREFAPAGDDWDRAVQSWRLLATDEGAVFDREVVIDCADIAPQVTWGTSPQQVIGLTSNIPDPADLTDPGERVLLETALKYIQLPPGAPLKGVKIDAAFIGSCTNARLSDLRAAAEILKGNKVSPHVLAICVPGSSTVKRAAEAEGIDIVFRDAGFEWHDSGCGMCGSGGDQYFAGKRVISTTNRNFEGRQGRGTRTHLASPATVAASAIAGEIFDVRNLA